MAALEQMLLASEFITKKDLLIPQMVCPPVPHYAPFFRKESHPLVARCDLNKFGVKKRICSGSLETLLQIYDVNSVPCCSRNPPRTPKPAYELALQYPESYVRARRLRRPKYRPNTPHGYVFPRKWDIHGLRAIPENVVRHPDYEDFNIDELLEKEAEKIPLAKLENLWPNLEKYGTEEAKKFWVEQLKRHGQWTNLAPADYLAAALAAAEKLDEDGRFATLKKDDSKMKLKRGLHTKQAIEQAYDFYVEIVVLGMPKGPPIITEAKIMYDSQMNTIPGSGVVTGWDPSWDPSLEVLLPF